MDKYGGVLAVHPSSKIEKHGEMSTSFEITGLREAVRDFFCGEIAGWLGGKSFFARPSDWVTGLFHFFLREKNIPVYRVRSLVSISIRDAEIK